MRTQASAMEGQAPGHRIELEVPAHARYLRVVRTNAAALAADLGWPLARVDATRLVVTELCAALIEVTPLTASLTVRFASHTGRLHVLGACPSARPPRLDGMAVSALRTTGVTYRLWHLSGTARFSTVLGPD